MNEMLLVIIRETLDVILVFRGLSLFFYDLLDHLKPRGCLFPLENELLLVILTFETKFFNEGISSLFAEVAEIKKIKIEYYLSLGNVLSLVYTENTILIGTIDLLVGIKDRFRFLQQIALFLFNSVLFVKQCRLEDHGGFFQFLDFLGFGNILFYLLKAFKVYFFLLYWIINVTRINLLHLLVSCMNGSNETLSQLRIGRQMS